MRLKPQALSSGEENDMSHSDCFTGSQRDDMIGEGEKIYREHVSAYRLSFGEIIVVVAAVVFLAGMAMVHRGIPPSSLTTGSISYSSSQKSGPLVRCNDDSHFLTDACEP